MEDGCWGLVPSSGWVRPVFHCKACRAPSEAVAGAAVNEGGENKKLQKHYLAFKHSLKYCWGKQHLSLLSERILWMLRPALIICYFKSERMNRLHLRVPLLICMMLQYVSGFLKRLAEWFWLCEAHLLMDSFSCRGQAQLSICRTSSPIKTRIFIWWWSRLNTNSPNN